jgi:hypothetical protein
MIKNQEICKPVRVVFNNSRQDNKKMKYRQSFPKAPPYGGHATQEYLLEQQQNKNFVS